MVALGYFDTNELPAVSIFAFVLLHKHKVYPAFAKAAAIAKPIPCEAPVITTFMMNYYV
jgi:hypothetical protein